jgi:hypothetical protein
LLKKEGAKDSYIIGEKKAGPAAKIGAKRKAHRRTENSKKEEAKRREKGKKQRTATVKGEIKLPKHL